MFIRLAIASLRSRRFTVGLTVLSIALSVALFLGIEKVRSGAREGFANTISGTDLIVGARTGDVQLLLASVFHIGTLATGVSPEAFAALRQRPEVEWAIPIAFGDSHRSYQVIGTDAGVFRHFRYAGDRQLNVQEGVVFSGGMEAVLGAEVARDLGYAPGDQIILSHGMASFSDHADAPVVVTGILAPTGTPFDQAVLVDLETIGEIHAPHAGEDHGEDDGKDHGEEHGGSGHGDGEGVDAHAVSVSAVLIGVRHPAQILSLQRAVVQQRSEPLLAIVPGLALAQLWNTVGMAEAALQLVSGMVVVMALLGMAVMMVANLDARLRELAVLRAIGARPVTIVGMVALEAILTSAAGAFCGIILAQGAALALSPLAEARLGITLGLSVPGLREGVIIGGVVLVGGLISLIPALRAYRSALSQGLSGES